MKKYVISGLGLCIVGLTYAQNLATETGSIASGTQSTYRQKLQAQSEVMKKLKDKDRVMMQELYNQQDTQVDLATISRDANDLTSQLNAISKEFTDISSQRKVLNKKYQQVKDAMQQVVNASRDTQQKVNERVEKIKTYSRELMETKKQIDQINQDTDNAKSLLIRFANVLYRANNEYYNGANDIDEIKILIKSDNIASTLSSEQLVAILAMRFDQLIDYLNSQNLKLEEREKRLDTLRLQYKDQVTDYNNEVELLKEQKKYLLEFLVLYRQDKINLDLQAQDLFDDREKLRAQIAQQLKETQDLMKNTDSVTAKKINSIEEREDGARFLSRPVYPIYNYTDAKNDPTYLSLYGDTNKGIDISAKQYTPVYAPADGVVTSVRDANGISLNRIVLGHKYGYVTLMSSLHTVYVKQGQTVKRGQLLGISGGEPGTRGAGFASNGPKLHIEVFKNSQPIHPFTVMDLSVIQNPTIIPFEYEFKLLSDKESRQVKLDQVEIMPGKSLSERRQQYLEKYGFGEFGRLSVRQDASAGRNVDIDLGICIATAESSMGRNLSSARNVGNVGNNDRGDRIDFETPAQGASMIYYALENKFLGQYATIYDLSGYGNKAGAIYASSEINWITNVSRCLTAIKGYRVPEDRPFRLPPDTNTASTPKS